MIPKEFEYIIIGGGTAGLSAYKSLKKISKSICIIDNSKFTTTCARVGCMPSKLLIAAAEASYNVDKAAKFGISVENKTINSKKIFERIRSERDRFLSFIEEDLKSYDQKDFIQSKASFINDNTIELNNKDTLTAKKFIIAVGSKTHIPELFQNSNHRILTSDDIFEFKVLPKSIAVIGTGVVGLEIGQALSRLGVKVRFFGRKRKIGNISDEIVLKEALNIFESKYPFEFNTEFLDLTENKKSVILKYTSSQNKKAINEEFEYVLLATGRKPDLKGLKLENTNLDLNENGMPSFSSEDYICFNKDKSKSNKFLIGDANNLMPLLHLASFEGKFITQQVSKDRQISKPVNLSIVFSDPQISSIGLSIKEIESKSINYDIGEVNFENQGRSRMFLKNEGLLRVYFNKDDDFRILGAEMCGPEAEYLGHILALAIKNNETKSSFKSMPFYHPTIVESLKTTLK